MMRIHTLKPSKGATHKKKRVGRGGKTGTTATRGTKGQKARSGYSRRFGFEGGRTPLVKQLPKLKGYKSDNGTKKITITLTQLETAYKKGGAVTSAELVRKGLISTRNTPWRVVATGEVKNSFTVPKKHITDAAQKIVEKAGGKIIGK